jgi:hypothetical protein
MNRPWDSDARIGPVSAHSRRLRDSRSDKWDECSDYGMIQHSKGPGLIQPVSEASQRSILTREGMPLSFTQEKPPLKGEQR